MSSPKDADFKPYEDQDSQDLLNMSASTSDTNGTPNRTNKPEKKTTRDRIAHRNFEKFRRDRLKVSLDKLKSLIPEEFLKKGASRVDKIKLIDSSCNYIEHMKNRVNKLEEQKNNPKNDPSLNKIEQDQWYIKGLFNGSIELIVFLMDAIKGRAATLSNFIRLTKLFIKTLREFHDIYFKTHGSSELKICDFLSCEETKRSFPFKSSRLKRKVFEMLDSEIDMPLEFFEEMMTPSSSSKKSWTADSFVESDMENDSDSQSDESDDGDSYRSNRNLDEKTELSFKSSSSSNKSMREKSKSFKYNQHVSKYSATKSVGSSSNESFHTYHPHKSQAIAKQSDDASSVSSSQKTKKLKSHYIERYISYENESSKNPSCSSVPSKLPTTEITSSGNNLNSPGDGGRHNQVLGDDAKLINPIVASKPHMDQSIRSSSNETSRTSGESLSIFILHASQDFYLVGSIDKCLINKNILSNFVSNPNYRPISMHKVKVDVDFTHEIIIT